MFPCILYVYMNIIYVHANIQEMNANTNNMPEYFCIIIHYTLNMNVYCMDIESMLLSINVNR